MKGNKAQVYAIDHHKGSKELKNSVITTDGGPINSLPQFRENIFRAGLNNIVTPLIGYSQDIGFGFDKKIDLLFIDGSHEHKDVSGDFDVWAPKVKKWAKILMHDAYYFAGPARLLAEIILEQHNRWFFNIHDYPNLAILKRLN